MLLIFVSLADIDHIEVLEGQHRAYSELPAFNGAINIVTKKAKEWGYLQSIEGGSFGSFGHRDVCRRLLKRGKWIPGLFHGGGYKRLGWRARRTK